ncbi:MAG: ABC transporter substrate binding protein [Candidatus Zixiibacteriota bacterium]
MKRTKIFLIINTIGLLFFLNIYAQTKKSFNIGYFEAGVYPVHSLLRNEFYNQLEQVLPEQYSVVSIPEGFRSALWNRDTCRVMAAQLAKLKHLDLLIAMGPWVVQDLLEAGFDKPIIAMHQFDPLAEGLLDANNQPVASNLTVHLRPGKIEEDLTLLSKLINLKRLGLLYFPSANEKDSIIANISLIGKKLGFEVVTSEGFNNVGTYAFFNAYRQLDKNIDAVYLPPLWGLDIVKLTEFFKMLDRDKIPSFVSEGKILLEKGAFATESYYSTISEARFSAIKTVRIIEGETPADLPVIFRSGLGLAVNNRTAMRCGITLPDEVLNDFFVIEAPLPDETPFYNLNDAINRAVTQNPGYLSQYHALEAAAQAAKQEYAGYLPRLYSTASFTHFDDDAIANLRRVFDDDQYSLNIILEQEIFSLYTIKSIQVAAKKRDIENKDLIQAQLDLELGVSLAYLNYLKASEQLSAYLNNRNLIEHNLEIARARNILEDADTLDIIRLEDERYQATSIVIEGKKNLNIARVFLNALFNMPGNQQFILDSTSFLENSFWNRESNFFTKINHKLLQDNIENLLVTKAIINNPQISQYQIMINLQKDLLVQNTSRYLPTIGFRSTLNFSDRLKETSFFNEEKSSWSVSGFIKLPIFLGTNRIHERGKLKAQLNEIEYQKDDISLNIMSTVQSEFHKLIAHANNMTPSYQSQKRSYQAIELVIKDYGAGKLPLLNLLDIQVNALRADIIAINTRYNYYQAMARLVHAVGWTTQDNYSNFLEEFHRQVK